MATPKTIAAVLLVLVATGVIHGRLTDRWGTPRSVLEAGARLDDVPREIAGWNSVETLVSDRVLQTAGAVKILHRIYSAPDSSDAVQIMIVCGRPGPVSRHPPTVCFTAGGMQQTSPVEPASLRKGDRSRQFVRCTFGADPLRPSWLTYWGWSNDGDDWSVPKEPRLAYAHSPWLYKLYIVATPESGDRELGAGRRDFIDQLLAELETRLL